MGIKIRSTIKKDQNHWYTLSEPVYYIGIATEHFAPFYYEDEVLYIEPQNKKTPDGKLKFDIVVKPFTWETHFWDGTSLLPDKGNKTLDALFRASLLHDVIYERVEQISKTTGIPVKCLLAFADDCLKLVADYNEANPFLTRIVHSITRFGGSIYHKLKKLLIVPLVLTISSNLACYSIQTTIDEIPTQINYSGPYTEDFTDQADQADQEDQADSSPVVLEANESIIVNQVNSNSTESILDNPAIISGYKSKGNPDCSKCVEDKDIQITDLKITSSGLTFKWVSKGNRWGLTESDVGLIACIGYGESIDKMTFAKFDWCRFSNTSRDFKNLDSGYNGLSKDILKSRCIGLFLMDKSGKKRTNILLNSL